MNKFTSMNRKIAYPSLWLCLTALFLTVSTYNSTSAQVPQRQGGISGVTQLTNSLQTGSRVYFGNSGAILEQVDSKKWAELGANEMPAFYFQETSRDGNTVILKDINRQGVELTIDLNQNVVKYNGSPLGNIVKTTHGEPKILEDEKGNQVRGLTAAIDNLTDDGTFKPEMLNVSGTNRADLLLSRYAAGVQHVQGVTKVGKTYVFSHDTHDGRKTGLMVVRNADGKSVFLPDFGDSNHPGAIQACGSIVIVTCSSGSTHFLDVKDPKNPVKCQVTIPAAGGAAGLVYDPVKKVHYALIGAADSLNDYFYKSNGRSLRDPLCSFTKMQTTLNGGIESNAFSERQGMSSLYYDVDTNEIVLVTMERTGGYETLRLMTAKPNAAGTIMDRKGTTVEKKIYKYDGDENWPGPSSRWGADLTANGTPGSPATSFELISVGRTLTGGAGINHAEVFRWKFNKPSQTMATGPIPVAHLSSVKLIVGEKAVGGMGQWGASGNAGLAAGKKAGLVYQLYRTNYKAGQLQHGDEVMIARNFRNRNDKLEPKALFAGAHTVVWLQEFKATQEEKWIIVKKVGSQKIVNFGDEVSFRAKRDANRYLNYDAGNYLIWGTDQTFWTIGK